jgi:hypothetical protein
VGKGGRVNEVWGGWESSWRGKVRDLLGGCNQKNWEGYGSDPVMYPTPHPGAGTLEGGARNANAALQLRITIHMLNGHFLRYQ